MKINNFTNTNLSEGETTGKCEKRDQGKLAASRTF
jgi:hypothetical protein